MEKTYKFTSIWSNHPAGIDSKSWDTKPPEYAVVNNKKITLYSDFFEEYIPDDADEQVLNLNQTYYHYGDSGVKVKIETFGEENLHHPSGVYTKKVTFIFPKGTELIYEEN